MGIPIKEAVQVAGGAAKVAEMLDISRISVYEWISESRLPPDRVINLSRLTGWLYTPHMLAPTLYPNPSDGLPPDLTTQQGATS